MSEETARAKELFVSQGLALLKDEVRKTEGAIRDGAERARHSGKDLEENVLQQVMQSKRHLGLLAAKKGERTVLLEKEFDDITRMPQFVAMQTGEKCIRFFVSSAEIRNRRGGDMFCIELPTDGSVKWQMGPVIDGKPPHFQNFCIGNIEVDVCRCLRLLDIAPALAWLVEYLERG